jgi:predicted nucleic acid-binding protein
MKRSIIVDTSVWIEYFNKPDSSYGEAVEQLLKAGRVVGTGIVLTELLQGARVRKEFDAILANIIAIPFLETTLNTWVVAGEISYKLRRKGITIPTTDLVIAGLSLEYNCLVFTLDPHFSKIPDIATYQE